jgi:hypothetical protein
MRLGEGVSAHGRGCAGRVRERQGVSVMSICS